MGPGGRPHPEEEPEAFRLWAGETERSLPKVAEMLGIPQRKLYEWHHRYRWDDRWTTEISDAAEPARRKARAEVVAGLSAAAQRLVAIVTDPSSLDKDAINAARTLLTIGLAELDVVPKARALTLVDARSIVANINSSAAHDEVVVPIDLYEVAGRIIESNVEGAEGTLRQGGRRR